MLERGMKRTILFGTIAAVAAVTIHSAYAQELPESLYQPGLEAVTTFATSVADTVPKMIAAAVLLAIGLVAGKVIGWTVKNIATKLLQKSTELGKDANKNVLALHPPSLIAATIRWFVYLFFIIAAINALEFEQLSAALTDLWLWVPNLMAFILVVVVGLIVINLVSKWVDQELIKEKVGGSKYIKAILKVVSYSIVFAIGITQLGIGHQIIPILVSAFSWSVAVGLGAAVAVGLGFALKDVIPSMIISATKQRSFLKVGEKIKVGEYAGTVTSVDLFHVALATDDDQTVIIPIKELDSVVISN